jgi:hypothetical protein
MLVPVADQCPGRARMDPASRQSDATLQNAVDDWSHNWHLILFPP